MDSGISNFCNDKLSLLRYFLCDLRTFFLFQLGTLAGSYGGKIGSISLDDFKSFSIDMELPVEEEAGDDSSIYKKEKQLFFL